MSISKRKIQANRRNALKSSGPVTPAGKETVSQNRTKHGLTGCFHVLEGESQEEFDYLLDEFVNAEKPADFIELQLVRKMVEATWMSKRAVSLQEGCITNSAPPELKALGMCATTVSLEYDRYLRYQAAHDRAYQKASKELRERRKQRELSARGFESQKRAEAAEQRKEASEIRKAEKHKVAIATANVRKQRLEMKFGCELADMLPPNFDPSSLNQVFSGAEPSKAA